MTSGRRQSIWICSWFWLRRLAVDGEADILARAAAPGLLVDEAPRRPGRLPIIRGTRQQDFGAFHPGDAGRRDQQELRGAADVLQHRIAAGEIDETAGRRPFARRGMGHTSAVDDLPQRVGIGGADRGRQSQEQKSRKQEAIERRPLWSHSCPPH
jgi:hypothetical protein